MRTVAALIVLVPSIGFAATYYSSPAGSGTACSLASPCTLNTGVGKLAGGDTLYLRAGTYQQTVWLGTSGSAAAYITVSAYPGEKAIIDGNNYALPASTWGVLLSVEGNYVRVRDLEVRYSNWMGVSVSGDYSEVINVYSHHHKENGILLSGDYTVADGCKVWYSAASNENGVMTRSSWASGLSAARWPTHATIKNCTVWENWGEGLSTYEATYTTIENNVVYNNWSTNIYLSDTLHSTLQRNLIYCTPGNAPGATGAQAGIMMGDENQKLGASQDNKIINNLVLGCNRNFYWWHNGLFSDGLTNDQILHNTFVNAAGTYTNFVIGTGGTHSGTIIKDNLVLEEKNAICSVAASSGLQLSYNLWSKTPCSNTGTTGNVVGDPQLAKAGATGAGLLTADYFRLLVGSPAIDAADPAGVTVDYFGLARGAKPDLGGIEYGSTLAPDLGPKPPDLGPKPPDLGPKPPDLGKPKDQAPKPADLARPADRGELGLPLPGDAARREVAAALDRAGAFDVAPTVDVRRDAGRSDRASSDCSCSLRARPAAAPLGLPLLMLALALRRRRR